MELSKLFLIQFSLNDLLTKCILFNHLTEPSTYPDVKPKEKQVLYYSEKKNKTNYLVTMTNAIDIATIHITDKFVALLVNVQQHFHPI